MRTHSMPTQAALRLVFGILLMDIIGISLLYPVAPYIVRRYSGDALMLTAMTAIYAAGQFFAAPLLGKLSDRYGRRPVLLVCLFGSALGYLVFGIGGALWVLIAARLIDGITGGNHSVASAYIADVSTPEERAKNFALVGTAWGVGLVLGPALGALLGQISPETPAFVAAALALASMLCGLVVLPESLPREQRVASRLRLRDLSPFASIGDIARKPGLGLLLCALCLFNFAFNGINSTASLFMIDKFAAQSWQVGLQLVLVGLSVAGAQIVLRLPWVVRYHERVIANASLLGQALGALAIFFAPTVWLLYPLSMLMSVLSGAVFAALGALTVRRVAQHEIGVLMGSTAALGSVMSMLGPLWGGMAYDYARGAPYWIGAGVLVVAALVLAWPLVGTARASAQGADTEPTGGA
jgi:DHA1 family tetracycline resistance protein-like MFS transporter